MIKENSSLQISKKYILNPGSAVNDHVKNFYYDSNGDDGGYNHFELKRYKRAYTLKNVFKKGDYAPPMREAANWIKDDYQNSGN